MPQSSPVVGAAIKITSAAADSAEASIVNCGNAMRCPNRPLNARPHTNPSQYSETPDDASMGPSAPAIRKYRNSHAPIPISAPTYRNITPLITQISGRESIAINPPPAAGAIRTSSAGVSLRRNAIAAHTSAPPPNTHQYGRRVANAALTISGPRRAPTPNRTCR